MIRRSSIFSFETLRLTPRFPRATLVALALLIAAEGIARHAVHTHRLHVDASARQLIDDHRAAVARNDADIWLLGNSTLGYGVDERLLARRTGARLLKLPHGSATVGASAKLLEYYLDIAPKPPRAVVVFVTKDDLNLNGYRAMVSAEYESLCNRPARKPQEYLMLWQARSHIADRMESIFDRAIHRGKKASTPAEHETHFDGKIASDDEMYVRLIQNFQMDRRAIPALASAAQRHGVKNVALVLVPCTDVYAQFHDRRMPEQPYAKLRADIAGQCATSGITFYDFGDPSTQYAEFYDGYHLNNSGAARFTARLVSSHVIVGPVDASATNEPPSSTVFKAPAQVEAGVAD